MSRPNSGSSGPIHFISWNVKGLQHPIKRSRIFAHLKTLGPEIMFLQETHLKRGWISQIYHSSYGDRSRGAAILIRKGVPFVSTKTISDTKGRYVIVLGKLFGNEVASANIYGPNWDDPQFFSKFFTNLPDPITHHLILGRDFNLVLEPNLDRSNPKFPDKLSKSASTIISFMDSYKLLDPWRHVNKTTKQYSFFFSPVHRSYSRIDFFLIDKSIFSSVSKCQYHSIVISDHCPVQLDLIFPDNNVTQRTWRLDPLLLSRKPFQNLISDQIDFFIEINSTPGMSYSTIWEALKAYLRGQIISYAAHEKKERGRRLADLSQQIKLVDNKYATSPSPSLYKDRLLLQSEFNSLSIKQTERLLLKTKQTYYEHCDKAGRLLSHQLKQSSADRTITEIRTEQGTISSHPTIINDQFKEFYSNLYASQVSAGPSEIQMFFEPLVIPKISPEDKSRMDSKISSEEITPAISSMQNGKMPGRDGLPVEF